MDRTERSSTIFSRTGDEETTIDDFHLRSILGKGSFGKVFLVEHKVTGRVYAMKSIRKDIVIDHEQIDNLKLEKDILLSVEHPFIIGMEFVFQTPHRIYFIMQFVRGGELFKHLTDSKRFTEDRARFYSA